MSDFELVPFDMLTLLQAVGKSFNNMETRIADVGKAMTRIGITS